MTYELIDVETGNLVGLYATERDAVQAAAETLRRCGQSAVESLALGKYVSPDDRGQMIATGRDLIERARRVAIGATLDVEPMPVPTDPTELRRELDAAHERRQR